MTRSFSPSVGALATLALVLAASSTQAQRAADAEMPAAVEDRILVQTWAQAESVLSSPYLAVVAQIPNQMGAAFKQNDVLLRFDCTEQQARQEIAQAELTAANEALAAKIRLKSLDAASEIEVTSAAAMVSKAQGQLKLSAHQVSQCEIKAPFDGYVVRVLGRAYQTANAGQPLLEIVQAGTPKLRVQAHSRWFRRIGVGTPLRVSIEETGQRYDATVTVVNARVDPVNQSFDMEARIEGEAPGLLPGMSGTASLQVARSDPRADRSRNKRTQP